MCNIAWSPSHNIEIFSGGDAQAHSNLRMKTTCPAEQSTMYRCEATSLEGFVKQLAVTYVARSKCFFYVTGTVSPRLLPAQHDRRIVEKYDLNISRFTRSRRKRTGIAAVHYLRYQNFWVLLAGYGTHKFFDLNSQSDPTTGERTPQFRDIRKRPLSVWFNWRREWLAYAIGYSGGKARVGIEQKRSYPRLKAHFVEMSTKRSLAWLIDEFYHIPFEPYGPVLRQLHAIKRAVNRARRIAGISGRVPDEAIPARRRRVCVFDGPSVAQWHATHSIPVSRERESHETHEYQEHRELAKAA